MAKKKFSRLSIMLEARDKMSRPIQKASQSSQKLERTMSSLSKSINKNRQTTKTAHMQNKLYADGYKNLSRRMSATNDKIEKSSRMFGSMRDRVKVASYSIQGFSRATKEAAMSNMIAKASIKMLKLGYNGIANTTAIASYNTQKLTKSSLNFVKSTRAYKSIAGPLEKANQYFKELNRNMKDTVRNTKGYQFLEKSIDGVNQSIKSTIMSNKAYIKGIPDIIKSTKAWQGVDRAVTKTKQSMVAGYTAFTMWKNSSRTVDRISNAFDKLTSKFPKFKKLNNSLRETNRQMDGLGRRRSTFNQMADANARLNRQVEKLNRQLSKSNRHLGSMRTNVSALNTIGLTFSGIYAAQGLGYASSGIAQATIGKAMEQNYNAEGLKVLVGKENGQEFYDKIVDYANSTAYAPEDWMSGIRGMLGRANSTEDLDKMMTSIEQLATLDPVQGIDGASLAVRELLSGDARSLVRRFELPRSLLNEFKNLDDPIEQIEKLSEVIGDTTGFSSDAVKDMKELPQMQWQKMTNSIKTAMGYMGQGAMEAVAPLMDAFNDAWQDGKFDSFIDNVNKKFGVFTENVIQFSKNLYSYFDSGKFQEQYGPFLELGSNIRQTLSENWPTIKEILGNMREILGGVADYLNENWPLINDAFSTTLGYIKDISNWVVENWPALQPIMETAATGFFTAAAGLKAMSIIQSIAGFLKLYKEAGWMAAAATWGFNAALWANPWTWVVLGLAALVTGIIMTIKHWDKLTRFYQMMWEIVKIVFTNIRNKISNAMYSARTAVTESVNGMIDSINSLIEKINKIPGIDAPLIPKIQMPKIPDVVAQQRGLSPMAARGVDGSHAGGLDYVPYDGYIARLHKGERVQTSSENKSRRSGNDRGQVVVTGNNFTVREEADIDRIAAALYRKLEEAETGGAI